MSYYYQRIIPNEVIHEIEKLILEGKTYREIKEIHKVSDGTITRIKQGKIKSNRDIQDRINLVPFEEVSEIKRQLQEARKALLESQKREHFYKSEFEKNKNAAIAEINIFNEINSLSFNQSNFDNFLKTNFGSKLYNLFKSQENEKLKDLQEKNEELKRTLRRMERPKNDFNPANGITEPKDDLKGSNGLKSVSAFNDIMKEMNMYEK